MRKISNFIVKHKFIVLCIVVAITIASLVCLFFSNVNSDILSYLPQGMTMTEGLDYLKTNFNMEGDAMIAVNNITYDEMKQKTDEMAKLNGITPGGVIWIGTMASMKDMDFSSLISGRDYAALYNAVRNYYTSQGLTPQEIGQKLANLMNMFNNMDTEAMVNSMLENESLLEIFYPKYEETNGFDPQASTCYVVMLQLNVPSSSDEAMTLLDNVGKICQDHEYAIGGSTQMVKEIFDSTINEIYKYIIVAVLVMFIILLLTTDSLVDPFIFMLTLGISILINMGTNIILPSVSIITFACSAVLQLGLSMDYAIFLMHSFSEERKRTLDDDEAMRRAIPKTFSTITASALTTVGGFLALFFMKFKIGADLGLVLAKGVFLSLLTVIFLQPVLMLFTSKLTNKTRHKIKIPDFKHVAKFSIKYRKIIMIVSALLLIPVIIMQNRVELNYIKFTFDPPNPTESEIIINKVENSTIVMLPVNKPEANKMFAEKVKNIDHVSAVMSVYTMVPEEMTDMIELLGSPDVAAILGKKEEMAMMSNFVNNGYTLFEIMLDSDTESQESTVALAEIKALVKECFGEETNYYLTGMAQAVEDLREITPTDFMIVTLVSVAIILVVLLFALKSFKYSAIIIAVIEFGIFINLSITYILGQSLNFMAYIIISSIQLGATVDYAILYADKYLKNLDLMPSKEAAYKALRDSGVSVMTSVAIMAGCTLSVALVTSNKIVSEICLMISRGSLISGILTLVLLPALMILFTSNTKLKKIGKHHKKSLKIVEKIKKKEAKLETVSQEDK